MTTSSYKSLILEALTKIPHFSKFVKLHNQFLEELKSSCVSYVKKEDTLFSVPKSQWIRQYVFDCSENDTIQVTLTNRRNSIDDPLYNTWNIMCYCDCLLGKLNINSNVMYQILDAINNNADTNLFGTLKQICNKDGNYSGIDNEQSKNALFETLKVQNKAKRINSGLKFYVGEYTLSLIDCDSYWELRGEIDDKDYGDIDLTEQSAKQITQCLQELAFQYPDQVFRKLKTLR